MTARVLPLLAVLTVAALGAAPSAMARSPRYLLVADRAGSRVTGSVVDVRSARTVLCGLDRMLVGQTAFSPDGEWLAWARGRSLWIGDVVSGSSLLAGHTPAGTTPYGFEIGRAGASVVFEDRGAAVVTLLARVGHRFIFNSAGLASLTAAPGLSADARFVAYVSNDQLWVASVRYEPDTIPLGSVDLASWSPAGHRIAYLAGGALHVLDVATGHTLELAGAITADWSPDGRYVAAGDAVLDTSSGAPIALPPTVGPTTASWRPGHPHDLALETYDQSSGTSFAMFDPATGSTTRSAPLVGHVRWSPDGRWLVDQAFKAVRLETPAGRPVRVPDALTRIWRSNYTWLAPNWLALQGNPLRIARPPTWVPHAVARSAPGHVLTAVRRLDASRSGLRLLARSFAPTPQRRCTAASARARP